MAITHEEKKARQRARYASLSPEQKQEKLAYGAKWRERNSEKVKAQALAYYYRNREKVIEYARKRYSTFSPERMILLQESKRTYLLRRYGLTPEKFSELLFKQKSSCAICLKPFATVPCIDHDHSTNKVRGLLCSACNLALGKFEDDPARARRAAQYLEENS